jgi:YggT family protein
VLALGNALMGVGEALNFLLQVYTWVLIGRAIVSWVSADPRNTIVRFLAMATDPVVERVRRLLPMKLRYFPLDLAFIVTFLIIIFLRYAVAFSLIGYGADMARRAVS